MKIPKILLANTGILLILLININFLNAKDGNLETNSSFSESVRLELAFPQLSFAFPVDFQTAPDNSNRIFVIEQTGRILSFENNNQVSQTEVFLDLQNRVEFGGEKGLLGVAFHPEFATNGFFYLNYTAANPLRSVISRFKILENNSNQADPASELILLEIPQPYSNHNGGQLAFGPDSMLYISIGDGGSAGDPQGNAQNRSNLLGAILRIDVNQTQSTVNYRIPPDNPLVGNLTGFREEIWAWGLRNPWRFSFDPATNRLWLADVGQSRIEEINLIEKGRNYGWKIMEGTLCYQPTSDCDTTRLALPIWEYSHDNGDLSIIGGYVYHGKNIPELQGKYIYGDYVSGRVWALNYDGLNEPENELLLETNLSITAFGVDQNRELYLLTASGAIYRFLPLSNDIPTENHHSPNFQLNQNFPNPFNATTVVRFVLSEPQEAALEIFNFKGQLVRRIFLGQQVGAGEIHWDCRNDKGQSVASGTYFYRLNTTGEIDRKKMILLK